VWRDRLRVETSGETGTPQFRGSIEEIREVDEEYIYSSEMQSSENTERLLNENPSAFLKPFSLHSSDKKYKTASLEANILLSEKSSVPLLQTRGGTFASLADIISSVPSMRPNGSENRDPKSNVTTPNTKAIDENLGTSSKQLQPLTSNYKENTVDENANNENRLETPSEDIHQEKIETPIEFKKFSSNIPKHITEAYSTVQTNVKFLSPINSQLEHIRKKHESNYRLFGQGRASPETANTKSKTSPEKAEKQLKKFTSTKELHPGNCKEPLVIQPRNSRDQLRNHSSIHSHSSLKANPLLPPTSQLGSTSSQFNARVSQEQEINRKQQMQKPKIPKTVASPLQPLPSNSEGPNISRKSEDKIITRVGNQSVTFNQLIQNLKKSSIKSPHKLTSLQIKD